MIQIPIFFTFDKNYVLPAAVAFHSLLTHADKRYFYRLYVLHTGLSVSSTKLLTRVIAHFDNASLEFIDVANYDINESIKCGKSHFSKEIFYKLIAADLFPQYDRIICSDVDVLFTSDISPSYFMFEDEHFYYAGVGQIVESDRMKTYGTDYTPEELYILEREIAAGYLLLNLKAIREGNMQQRMVDFYQENYYRLRLPEQDCMILCCWPDVRFLPMEYVVCNNYYLTQPQQVVFYPHNPWLPITREACVELYQKALLHPIQLHYVGAEKPWNSFNVPRQISWFMALKEAQLINCYFSAMPLFVLQRMKRYSLRRFLQKVIYKLCNIIDS